jgi:hypothetical protein
MHAHVFFFATNTDTSFHTLHRGKKGKKGKKRKRNKKRNGRLNKKEKKAVVRTFALSCSPVLFLVARFIVALRRVPRPPGASSLLSVSRITISRQQPQQN